MPSPFRRRPRAADALAPQQSWPTRTITLVGDRDEVDRICQAWAAEGWQVMTVDAAKPSVTGLPTHVVRVAVPPADEIATVPSQASPLTG